MVIEGADTMSCRYALETHPGKSRQLSLSIYIGVIAIITGTLSFCGYAPMWPAPRCVCR